MTGQHEQQPWAWMQGKHPERALGYSDTAYVCSPNYSLGSNAQVPNHMFEVAGLLQIGTAGVVDADPGQILPQLLTHANPIFYMVNAFRYGLLGTSDVPLWVAYALMLGFAAALATLSLWLLRRGVGLRS